MNTKNTEKSGKDAMKQRYSVAPRFPANGVKTTLNMNRKSAKTLTVIITGYGDLHAWTDEGSKLQILRIKRRNTPYYTLCECIRAKITERRCLGTHK